MNHLRDKAKELVEKYISDKYHRTHALMVALAMEGIASRDGKDRDLYYVTGLVHDIDYGADYPVDKHTIIGAEILRKEGFPEEVIHAVQAHNSKISGVMPKTHLDFSLIASDEISGLFYAYALMRPERFQGMTVKSFKKKFKDKSFARGVDRGEILMGIEGIGSTLEEHVEFLISIFAKNQDLIIS